MLLHQYCWCRETYVGHVRLECMFISCVLHVLCIIYATRHLDLMWTSQLHKASIPLKKKKNCGSLKKAHKKLWLFLVATFSVPGNDHEHQHFDKCKKAKFLFSFLGEDIMAKVWGIIGKMTWGDLTKKTHKTLYVNVFKDLGFQQASVLVSYRPR
jgi:hypothetical protein